MSENKTEIENRKKRMSYRAWHRGTQEMDLILGNFANENLPRYNKAELDRFEKLMNEHDVDLLKWIMGQEPVPDDVDLELVEILRKAQIERTKA